jgi:hypothetical protein
MLNFLRYVLKDMQINDLCNGTPILAQIRALSPKATRSRATNPETMLKSKDLRQNNSLHPTPALQRNCPAALIEAAGEKFGHIGGWPQEPVKQ